MSPSHRTTIPDKEGQYDTSTQKVEDKEEDRVPLRIQILRLFISPNNGHGSRGDVDPTLERDNFEQD